MSWANDYDMDCWEPEDYEASRDCEWIALKNKGYIWEDVKGTKYKPKDLDNKYLLNILKFCKRNYRPDEQIKALKALAIQRGLLKRTRVELNEVEVLLRDYWGYKYGE